MNPRQPLSLSHQLLGPRLITDGVSLPLIGRALNPGPLIGWPRPLKHRSDSGHGTIGSRVFDPDHHFNSQAKKVLSYNIMYNNLSAFIEWWVFFIGFPWIPGWHVCRVQVWALPDRQRSQDGTVELHWVWAGWLEQASSLWISCLRSQSVTSLNPQSSVPHKLSPASHQKTHVYLTLT